MFARPNFSTDGNATAAFFPSPSNNQNGNHNNRNRNNARNSNSNSNSSSATALNLTPQQQQQFLALMSAANANQNANGSNGSATNDSGAGFFPPSAPASMPSDFNRSTFPQSNPMNGFSSPVPPPTVYVLNGSNGGACNTNNNSNINSNNNSDAVTANLIQQLLALQAAQNVMSHDGNHSNQNQASQGSAAFNPAAMLSLPQGSHHHHSNGSNANGANMAAGTFPLSCLPQHQQQQQATATLAMLAGTNNGPAMHFTSMPMQQQQQQQHHQQQQQQLAASKVNGTQYDPAATYEGYVKRYNPVRGFGFLTATHQIVSLDANHNTNSSTSSCNNNNINENGGSDGSVKNASPMAGSFTFAGPNSANGETDSTNSNSNTAGGSADQQQQQQLQSAQEVKVPVHLGDIFVHQSYVHMRGFRSLPVGGRVRFCVGFLKGQHSFQAVEVELLPQVLPHSFNHSTTSSSFRHGPDSNMPSSFNSPMQQPQVPHQQVGHLLLQQQQAQDLLEATFRSTNSQSGLLLQPANLNSGSGCTSPVSFSASHRMSTNNPFNNSTSHAKNFNATHTSIFTHTASSFAATEGADLEEEEEEDSPLVELAADVLSRLAAADLDE